MKKRILIFSEYPDKEKPTYYSFIKTRVIALKDMFEVMVVSVNKSRNIKEKITTIQEDGYLIKKINIKEINIPKIRVPLYDMQVKKPLFQIVKEFNPDIIHVHFTSYYSWLVHDVSKKFHIPYCITEHATFFEDRVNHSYYGPRMKMALNEADAVISVSKPLKKIMSKYTSHEIIVKSNIVSVEKFALKENNNYSTNYPIHIISVGSLNKNDKKGYEILLASLKMLKNKAGNFKVSIIGDGENKERLEGLIHEYELEDQVYLLGSISNELLQDYYHEADFYVSSSRIETFGVVLLEAMSCGLPVVATKSGGPEDFITDEVGILIESNNCQALCEGIYTMINKYKTYDSKRIRDYVVNNYSMDAYRKNTLRIYEGILK